MKHSRRLAFHLPILAIVGSACGVRAASAEVIELLTGSWAVQSADFAAREKQSINALEGPIDSTFTVRLSFDGSISDYVNQGAGCTPLSWPCTETWSGVFTGGTVDLAAYNQVEAFTGTGAIAGGSFSGLMFCDFDECLGENVAMFSFVSRWANGWSSEGTLRVSGCVGNCGHDSFGTLTMTTTAIPEPGTMTLLGAGVVAAATFLRRRRSPA